MAETLVSPGVLARENDQSFVTQQPVTVGAAIVGPTVKGPVEIPTLVRSYSDYQNRFGTSFTSGSDTYSYFTSIAAQNYFVNGGETLLVTRVVSGSAGWDYADAYISGSNTSGSLWIETIDKGNLFNNANAITGTVSTWKSRNFVGSYGALTSGSTDNVRWEVVSRNVSTGTFDLLVRRGDDDANNKNVLETWTNLSMDPKAPNYVAAVIGNQNLRYNSTENYIEVSGSYPNQSRYIRIKQVVSPTPDYFDNAGNPKDIYTGSIPVNGTGSYGGCFAAGTGNILPGSGYGAGKYYNEISSTNTQGLKSGDYTNMLTLLANQDDYRFNALITPGLYYADYSAPITTAINNTQGRGDNIYVTDLRKYGATIANATSEAANINSSYVSTYWPWVQVRDTSTSKDVWVPASTMIAGVYAYNDSVSEPWFAPAGINRGGLSTVISAERKLSQSNRNALYAANVNPIATFPGTGVVVYGQKTLQRRASALDRVNVRRLLIALKSYISQVAQNLVFEQNTIATRNNFLAQVNPYLESVQQRQGLYAFKVVMDDSNNTPDVIDRNQLIGQIYLQPTKTAEFIYLDFNILPTGATFPA
jgi:uncharacterized protein